MKKMMKRKRNQAGKCKEWMKKRKRSDLWVCSLTYNLIDRH